MAEAAKRLHRATYSRDNRNGGYIIRVEGPTANRFAGRTIPVVLKSGEEHNEELDGLIWTGKDEETGKPVALYSFKSKPVEDLNDEIPF